jgi:BTB/POZ domain
VPCRLFMLIVVLPLLRLESLCTRADYRAWARFGEQAPTILSSTFCFDMSGMVNMKDYSDIVFRVITSLPSSFPLIAIQLDTGEEMHAHRVILATRSAYFHRMFEGNFKERDQGAFNCDEGLSFSSFLAFLAFLYTGM